MDTLQEEPAVSQTQTYTEPVQETYVEPVQEAPVEPVQETYVEPVQEAPVEPVQNAVAEPEPQAPAATVLTIQTAKNSVVKGKTLQLDALINEQATVYDKENDASYPVLWTVSGANAKGTTISASGLLTVAADETATSLTVTATLKSDLNNTCFVNLQIKEPQKTQETVDEVDEVDESPVETVINEDGTNDIEMALLESLLNP